MSRIVECEVVRCHAPRLGLRVEKFVEVLLDMWEVEYIGRAYGCSVIRMEEDYISRFKIDDLDTYQEVVDWYGNLIRMMNQEGKREKGHLTINELVVQQLTELNAQLLQSPKFPFYNAEYYKVLPFIVELRNKGSKDITEIETCLNALYGVMLLRLQDKEVSPQTQNAVKEISTFLGMLSDYYIKTRQRSRLR